MPFPFRVREYSGMRTPRINPLPTINGTAFICFVNGETGDIMKFIDLVRDLNPDDGIVSESPAVMARRDRAHITRAEYLFFPVIHPDPHSP
jgi:hypothetical protein